MGLVSETAELITNLRLRDELTPGMQRASGELSRADAQAAKTQTRMSGLQRATTGAGGAFSHLKGHIGGLLGAAGLIGLGGAAFGVEHILHESITAAENYGDAVRRLSGLTGESAQQAGVLTGVLSHFGIAVDAQTRSIGLQNKALGAMMTTKGAAVKFEKQYGLQITDSNGRMLNSNDLLLQVADYYNNKSVPAQVKATAISKLYGRSWQDLLPVLMAGKDGISAVAEEQAKLNPISTQNLADLNNLKTAQRDLSSAWETLQTQIGLQLIPSLKDLAGTLAVYLSDPKVRDAIKGLFQSGIEFVKGGVTFIKNTVIPTVSSIAHVVMQGWNMIPAPLRDLLIKGFVADRTIKFLFGFSLGDVAKNVVGDAIGGWVKNLIGRGSPANPMFVVAEGGGALGGAGAAGGGLGRALGTLGAVTIAGASIYALATTFRDFQAGVAKDQAALQDQADKAGAGKSAAQAMQDLATFTGKLKNVSGFDRMLGDTFGGKQELDALQNLADATVSNGKLNTADTINAIQLLKDAQVQATARGNSTVAAHIGRDIATLQSRLAGPAAQTAANTQQIANQPTTVNVATTVNTSVSTRDVQKSTYTSSRYGIVAS